METELKVNHVHNRPSVNDPWNSDKDVVVFFYEVAWMAIVCDLMSLQNSFWSFGADERWVSVEEVWSKDGQGQSLPSCILPVHCCPWLPSSQAGNNLLPFSEHLSLWFNDSTSVLKPYETHLKSWRINFRASIHHLTPLPTQVWGYVSSCHKSKGRLCNACTPVHFVFMYNVLIIESLQKSQISMSSGLRFWWKCSLL